MGSRSNYDNKMGNKRVEVPLYQKKGGGYGAKSDLQPVKVTAKKKPSMDVSASMKTKIKMKVDHAILKDGSKFE